MWFLHILFIKPSGIHFCLWCQAYISSKLNFSQVNGKLLLVLTLFPTNLKCHLLYMLNSLLFGLLFGHEFYSMDLFCWFQSQFHTIGLIITLIHWIDLVSLFILFPLSGMLPYFLFQRKHSILSFSQSMRLSMPWIVIVRIVGLGFAVCKLS